MIRFVWFFRVSDPLNTCWCRQLKNTFSRRLGGGFDGGFFVVSFGFGGSFLPAEAAIFF